MKLFLDRKLGILVAGLATAGALIEVAHRRGGVTPLEVVGVEDGAAVALPASMELAYAVKAEPGEDAVLLGLGEEWSKAGDVYRGELDLSGVGLKNFMGDSKARTLVSQLQWRESGEDAWQRSQIVRCRVENAVYEGTEPPPEMGDDPEEYVAARAVLHSEEQTLETAAKVRARGNIDAVGIIAMPVGGPRNEGTGYLVSGTGLDEDASGFLIAAGGQMWTDDGSVVANPGGDLGEYSGTWRRAVFRHAPDNLWRFVWREDGVVTIVDVESSEATPDLVPWDGALPEGQTLVFVDHTDAGTPGRLGDEIFAIGRGWKMVNDDPRMWREMRFEYGR